MTRTRNACVLAIVLVCGLALARSTRPVAVYSVISNATSSDEALQGVLFANGATRVAAARAAAARAAAARAAAAHATVATPSPKLGEQVSPSEFFDRK